MKVTFHRYFNKEYWKLSKDLRYGVDERITLFIENPRNPILNLHPLKGKYKNHQSINISGDIRAIYKMISNDMAVFVAIGPHNKLYR